MDAGKIDRKEDTMKYLKQFGIIMVITFIGELLKYILPLPVPASIYGLIILFVALLTGIIKLEQVKETAGFLITIMPIMFVPAGVQLLESWQMLQGIVGQVIVIMIVSTIVVMVISGRVTQSVMWLGRKQKKENENE